MGLVLLRSWNFDLGEMYYGVWFIYGYWLVIGVTSNILTQVDSCTVLIRIETLILWFQAKSNRRNRRVEWDKRLETLKCIRKWEKMKTRKQGIFFFFFGTNMNMISMHLSQFIIKVCYGISLSSLDLCLSSPSHLTFIILWVKL